MRDFLRFERRELLVFGLCALLYVAIWLTWTVLPLAGGQSIADMVRLIRLTRPDVILTWLPARVAGENHGGHQASGGGL